MMTVIVFVVVLSMGAPFVSTIISMGVLLVVSALLITLIISSMFNSWFGFILFLIYITGLLVLFSYMMAMSPNMYQISYNFIFKFVLVSFGLMALFCSFLFKIVSLSSYGVSFEWWVMPIFSNVNMVLYWVMAFVLLIALVLVVNLCYKSPSPLRPFL